LYPIYAFLYPVLCAEVLYNFLPKLVHLHNYSAANSVKKKKVNWETLNRKVFRKIGIHLTDATIQGLIDARHGVIETVIVIIICSYLL